MHSEYVAESRVLIEFGGHNELGRKGGRERIEEGRREGEGRQAVFLVFQLIFLKMQKIHCILFQLQFPFQFFNSYLLSSVLVS